MTYEVRRVDDRVAIDLTNPGKPPSPLLVDHRGPRIWYIGRLPRSLRIKSKGILFSTDTGCS